MNHKKIEAIKQISLGVLVVAILFGLLHYLNAPERKRLKQVQAGELILECHIKKTGLTIIAPEKVTGHSDITWWFTNGVSSRCTTKNTSELDHWELVE